MHEGESLGGRTVNRRVERWQRGSLIRFKMAEGEGVTSSQRDIAGKIARGRVFLQ